MTEETTWYNNPKAWWRSRAAVGSFFSTIGVVGAAFGIGIDANSLTEIVLLGGALLSNALTLWGNLNRKQPIDPKQILPGVRLP